MQLKTALKTFTKTGNMKKNTKAIERINHMRISVYAHAHIQQKMHKKHFLEEEI